ncbi:MAG: type IV secretion system protein [Methylococcaceae bacterium]
MRKSEERKLMDSLISSIIAIVDDTTDQFIFNTFQSVVSNILPLTTTIMTLFFVLYGYAWLQGRVQKTGGDLIFSGLKIAFIYSFMMSWPFFSSMVVDLFTKWPDELAGLILSANSHSHQSATTIMDQFIQTAISSAGKAWSAYSWGAGAFVCILIMLSAGIFAGFMVGIIMITKIGLALLLGLAPIFLLAYMIKPTEQMFESWVRYTVGLALTPLFVYGAALIVLPLMDFAVASGQTGFTAGLKNAFGLLVITFPGVFFMRQAQNTASSIGGGIALGSERRTRKQMQKGQKQAQKDIKQMAAGIKSLVSTGKLSKA